MEIINVDTYFLEGKTLLNAVHFSNFLDTFIENKLDSLFFVRFVSDLKWWLFCVWMSVYDTMC